MKSTDELRAALAGLAMQGLLARGEQLDTITTVDLAIDHADTLIFRLNGGHYISGEPTGEYVNQDR